MDAYSHVLPDVQEAAAEKQEIETDLRAIEGDIVRMLSEVTGTGAGG